MTVAGRLSSATVGGMVLSVVVATAVASSSSTPSSATRGTVFPTTCPTGAPLPSGTIVTIAGTGVAGDTGDGGPAVAADISPSFGTIAFDASGALYFADIDHQAIRHVGTDGIISTFAGPRQAHRSCNRQASPSIQPGTCTSRTSASAASGGWTRRGPSRPSPAPGVVGSSGDDGPATEAEHRAVRHRHRAPRATCTSTTSTGTGPSTRRASSTPSRAPGRPGSPVTADLPTKATFSTEIVGVAADAAGNVYLGDRDNFRVRKVDPAGIITTVAGSGREGYSGDGGPALDAALGTVHGVAVDDAGDLYLTDDFDSSTIRKVDRAGIISTVAGTGPAGFSGDCGPATEAQLSHPDMVAVHDGVVYIVDNGNNRIRMVVP